MSYNWAFLRPLPAGSGAVLFNPSIVNPTFVPDVAGNYWVQLVVNDGTNDSDPDLVIVTAVACDMDITKAGPTDPVSPGERFTYSITVHNAGGASCSGVEVVDSMPKGVRNISPITCNIRGRTVTCDLGTMNPNDTVLLEFSVEAPKKSGTLTNQVSVTTSSDDIDPYFPFRLIV